MELMVAEQQNPKYDSAVDRLVDHLVAHGLEFDQVYPYDQLEDVAEKPRHVLYRLMGRANKRLGQKYSRYLKASPEHGGYRVLRPEEHGEQALRHLDKSRNQVAKAGGVLSYADMGRMTPAQRDEHITHVGGMAALARSLEYHTGQLKRQQTIQQIDQLPDNDWKTQVQKELSEPKSRVLPSG